MGINALFIPPERFYKIGMKSIYLITPPPREKFSFPIFGLIDNDTNKLVIIK